MLKNVYEGLNARSKVYLSKVYFCKMYPTCVSSKLCEFICDEVQVDRGIRNSNSLIQNRQAYFRNVYYTNGSSEEAELVLQIS